MEKPSKQRGAEVVKSSNSNNLIKSLSSQSVSSDEKMINAAKGV